jgi:hypothetical protein
MVEGDLGKMGVSSLRCKSDRLGTSQGISRICPPEFIFNLWRPSSYL